MDKYEKEFRKRMKNAASSITVDKKELASLRIKRFSAMIYHLISDTHPPFDIVVGGGNSGVFMSEITKMVYDSAGVALPHFVVFPVVRPSINQNARIDPEFITEKIVKIGYPKRILFVDDEIMRGQTVKICLKMIRSHVIKTHPDWHATCTIVAENHFFVWRYELPEVSVRFMPFSFVLQGYNANFTYCIPQKLLNLLQTLLSNNLIDRNQAMAVLLGGKRKMTKNSMTSFDSSIEKEIIEKFPGYIEEKIKVRKNVELLIREGMQEYIEGKIQFQNTEE